MKNLKRLTSVFLCTVLLSFALAVPASAEFDSSDSRNLQNIYIALTNSSESYLFGLVKKIANNSTFLDSLQYFTKSPGSYTNGSLFGVLDQISKVQIPNVSTNFGLWNGYGTNGLLNLIEDHTDDIYGLLRSGSDISSNLNKIQQNTLASADRTLNIYKALSAIDDHVAGGNNVLESINNSIGSVSEKVTRLADVLASDTDVAIRDAQEANTNIVKDTYLSGSSSGSSLGSTDLKQFSTVGNLLKDSLNLNGQAQVSGIYIGYKRAADAGLGWFSQSTKDSLDSVSGNDSISTFSVDSDSDPYNMAGFYDNYLWLWGKTK